MLSKYPHSDPPTGEWDEGIMMGDFYLREKTFSSLFVLQGKNFVLKGKNVFFTVRTPGTELKIFANRMDEKMSHFRCIQEKPYFLILLNYYCVLTSSRSASLDFTTSYCMMCIAV